MYFTDTPELRKFEREMRQKPNFDRRNDECDENEIAHFSDNKKLNTDRNKKVELCYNAAVRERRCGFRPYRAGMMACAGFYLWRSLLW